MHGDSDAKNAYEQKFALHSHHQRKKCVSMVGDADVFYLMIDNVSQAKRYSGMRERIDEALKVSV